MPARRVRTYLRKRSSGYTAIFYDPDRRPEQKYVTLRTSDKRVARRRLTQMEDLLSRGEYDPWTDNAPREGVSVAEAIDQFLAEKDATCRASTVRAYRGALRAFDRQLPIGMLVDHVEPRHCRSFYRRDDLSASSQNTYARQLRTFFRWCADEGIISQNPMEALNTPRAPAKVVSFLSRKQYERLLRAIDAHLDLEAEHIQDGEVVWFKDLVQVAVGSGLRSSELRSMRWNWVDLEEGALRVRVTPDFTPKNGDERTTYIHGEALAVLRRRYEEHSGSLDDLVFPGVQSGQKMGKDYIAKRFRFFRDLAKLPKHLHFHSLRHTFCSWLVQAGVDLYRVKELAGHKSIQTTLRYAHLRPDDLKDAVERTFGMP